MMGRSQRRSRPTGSAAVSRAPLQKAGLALAAVASAGLLVGCSQFAELQPVAGDEITSVKIATNDVLQQKDVKVLVWPVCSFTDQTYVCKGSAIGGAAITSSVPVKDPLVLTVSVGGEKIFTGPVEPVITAEARTP